MITLAIGCSAWPNALLADEHDPTPTEEAKEFNAQDLSKEFGNLLKGFGNKKELEPHRLQQLQIDHQRARAEYAELLRIIPLEDQVQFPGIEKQKNAFPAIKTARAKFVELSKMYEDPEAGETQDYVDYLLGEAAESAVPWERDEDLREIERWLTKNQPYTLALTKAIQEADYCSRFEHPGLVYDEKSDDFDFTTIRECFEFLVHRFHYQCRRKDWNAAQQELELMIRCSELQFKTRGCIIDYMTCRAQVSDICSAAERLLKQPDLPLSQMAKILDSLLAFAKTQPSLADYLAIEVQRYYIAKIAQIPLFKTVRDQVPAMHLLCYRDRPPAGLKLAEEKGGQEFLIELYGYYCLLLERAAPALEGHPLPFDKAETIRLLWKEEKKEIEDYRRLPFPHARKSKPVEQTEPSELDLLNEDKAQTDAILFPSQSARTPLPALPEKTIQILRQRFKKQTNPLGRLYLERNGMSESKSRLLLAPASKEFVAVTIIKTACHLYERNLNHRPQVLEDLVKQGYLKEVPLSHYTGEPFGYDAVRGMFWRTGKQGTENGIPPQPKPDEINLGESGYGIQRLLSAPPEDED